MEPTIHKQSDIRFDLEVTLTPEQLEPYRSKVFRSVQKNISLKGFRKGHVPPSVIKQMYGKGLEQEVMEEAVQGEFERHAREQNVQPVGAPQVTHLHPTEDGGVHFTVSYEIMPTIELKDYRGLPARRIVHTITEEEFDSEMESLRGRYGTLEDAETAADENHGVTVDLQKLVDGEPEEGSGMNDVKINLRDERVNPELRAALTGASVGDVREVELPTGEGETMQPYRATVKDIKRITLPDLTNEFAAQVMGREDAVVEDLQEALRGGMEGEYERRYQQLFRDALINELINRHPFEVPRAVVAQVLESMVDDQRDANRKLPENFNRDEFITGALPTAERVARWALLRDMIVEREELTADPEDYEALAEADAARTGIDHDMLLKYYRKNESVRDRIIAEKAIQFLEDYAVVEEIDDTTLAQQANAQPTQQEIEGSGTEPVKVAL